MSKVDEVEKIFKAVQAFPDDVRIASLAQDCMAIVSDLERQLEDANQEIDDLSHILTELTSLVRTEINNNESKKDLVLMFTEYKIKKFRWF